MSSDSNYTIKTYIKNSTDTDLSYAGFKPLSSALSSVLKSAVSVPAKGSGIEAFSAETPQNSDHDPLAGTVQYSTTAGTTLQIQFQVVHETNNGSSIGCTGSLCNNTIFYTQTDSSYSKAAVITSDSNPEIYFLVSKEALTESSNTVTSTQISILQSLPQVRQVTQVDAATVMNKSCENYNEERVVELFQGHEYASPRDILDVKGVPKIDKVDIIFKVDFLSVKESLIFGVVFSELLLNLLEEQSELAGYATDYLTALKATLLDNESSKLGESYTKLADKSDAVFEELSEAQKCTIEILRSLIDIRAMTVPLFIKSRIDVLAEDSKKKKELENFMFNYLNDLSW